MSIDGNYSFALIVHPDYVREEEPTKASSERESTTHEKPTTCYAERISPSTEGFRFAAVSGLDKDVAEKIAALDHRFACVATEAQLKAFKASLESEGLADRDIHPLPGEEVAPGAATPKKNFWDTLQVWNKIKSIGGFESPFKFTDLDRPTHIYKKLSLVLHPDKIRGTDTPNVFTNLSQVKELADDFTKKVVNFASQIGVEINRDEAHLIMDFGQFKRGESASYDYKEIEIDKAMFDFTQMTEELGAQFQEAMRVLQEFNNRINA